MRNISRIGSYIVILIFSAVHLLLPIERGFPVIRIGGYPITLPILVSAVLFTFLFIKSGGRIMRGVSRQYVIFQAVLVWIFFISALISKDIEAGLFVVLSYAITFIVDFLILFQLFKMGFRQKFSVILCFVASIAVLIGIIEGVFHYYFPFYKQIFLNYDYQRMSYAMIRPDFRVLGTLGNPIVYSVAMVLVIPFAMEIKNSFVKYVVVTLLIVASLLAVSTTSLAIVVILFVGYYLLLRSKTRFILLGAGALGLVIAFLIIPFVTKEENGFLSFWITEFSLFDPENPQSMNVTVRYDLLLWSFKEFWDNLSFSSVFFGYGAKSTREAVEFLQLGNLRTIDNTYLTLLFENGILGLFAFLLMGLNLLLTGYKKNKRSLHWYGILSLLIASMAFTTIHYSSFNFIWVASVATMIFDRQYSQQIQMVRI